MTATSSKPKAVSPRLDYLDYLRVGMMLLGIPYHAEIIWDFASSTGQKPSDQSQVINFAMEFIHSFRMFGFFVVSGYFSVLILDRSEPKSWLKSRAFKLGLPLFTGVFLLSPFHLSAIGFARTDTFGLIEYPSVYQPGPHWLLHMWFLITLLCFTIVLALSWQIRKHHVFRTIYNSIHNAVSVHEKLGWMATLLILSLVGLTLSTISSWSAGRYDLIFGIYYWRSVLENAPAFLIGGFLATDARLIDSFTRFRWSVIAASIAISTAYLGLPSDSFLLRVSKAALWLPCGFILTQGLLMALRPLPSAGRTLSTFVDAAFTIYVVHMAVVMWLGALSLHWDADPSVAWAAIIPTAAVFAFGFYIAARRSLVMSYLFNGSRYKFGKYAVSKTQMPNENR